VELAVASGATRIVTFNLADFAGVEQFGIQAVRPKDVLKELGEIG
jgi:hypothetical protein